MIASRRNQMVQSKPVLKAALIAISFVTIGSLLFSGAHAATPMLPPELHAEEADWGQDMAILNEPPLWQHEAADGYQRRLRLFLFSTLFGQRIAIRIDTNSSGETTGHVIRMKDRMTREGSDIIQDRTFSVNSTDLAALNDLIAQSKLWQIYPEYWTNTSPNSVCVHGVQMMMERVEQGQYRFSAANAQCTAPASMLRVAAKMIDLASSGASDAAWWLN